jgi:uncharacterized protein YbaA (DUF1428 family)
MPYVDGYVIPIAKKNVAAYVRMAKKASKIFKEHGALEFRECVGEDLNASWGTPYTRLLKLKRNETLFFSWVVYKSRAARDQANKKVMADPRLAAMMDEAAMPFDMKRMSVGGFKVMVEA